MRELTINEIEQVSGGGDILATIQEWSAFGATTGSVWGYVVTGTVHGATRFGLAGGALGFAAGGGYALGSLIADAIY